VTLQSIAAQQLEKNSRPFSNLISENLSEAMDLALHLPQNLHIGSNLLE
jgi:hypothetical protein